MNQQEHLDVLGQALRNIGVPIENVNVQPDAPIPADEQGGRDEDNGHEDVLAADVQEAPDDVDRHVAANETKALLTTIASGNATTDDKMRCFTNLFVDCLSTSYVCLAILFSPDASQHMEKLGRLGLLVCHIVDSCNLVSSLEEFIKGEVSPDALDRLFMHDQGLNLAALIKMYGDEKLSGTDRFYNIDVLGRETAQTLTSHVLPHYFRLLHGSINSLQPNLPNLGNWAAEPGALLNILDMRFFWPRAAVNHRPCFFVKAEAELQRLKPTPRIILWDRVRRGGNDNNGGDDRGNDNNGGDDRRDDNHGGNDRRNNPNGGDGRGNNNDDNHGGGRRVAGGRRGFGGERGRVGRGRSGQQRHGDGYNFGGGNRGRRGYLQYQPGPMRLHGPQQHQQRPYHQNRDY